MTSQTSLEEIAKYQRELHEYQLKQKAIHKETNQLLASLNKNIMVMSNRLDEFALKTNIKLDDCSTNMTTLTLSHQPQLAQIATATPIGTSKQAPTAINLSDQPIILLSLDNNNKFITTTAGATAVATGSSLTPTTLTAIPTATAVTAHTPTLLNTSLTTKRPSNSSNKIKSYIKPETGELNSHGQTFLSFGNATPMISTALATNTNSSKTVRNRSSVKLLDVCAILRLFKKKTNSLYLNFEKYYF
jgi:hypothetical protein